MKLSRLEKNIYNKLEERRINPPADAWTKEYGETALYFWQR
jgi:hypothetical protein